MLCSAGPPGVCWHVYVKTIWYTAHNDAHIRRIRILYINGWYSLTIFTVHAQYRGSPGNTVERNWPVGGLFQCTYFVNVLKGMRVVGLANIPPKAEKKKIEGKHQWMKGWWLAKNGGSILVGHTGTTPARNIDGWSLMSASRPAGWLTAGASHSLLEEVGWGRRVSSSRDQSTVQRY